ncbi:hypothetical protein ASPACDRAFT_47103 [Aspergillus aculeatus ATCC 16872]|uniref:Uncharacterized protein n=1 Tax=Aspergillus aculeatus (strain ATCC 16872 / CBS 172.66 / WB 5094) TaxID=690307 RepID=A0A1L9WJJ7_ASPA1|nr:uncharacterized protein ASPACDRAFT_47103 [Aspergillus aculeatus ATCC 16872]OJJ96333.1 hypothetical protein ASPACDRAFT_47103 [Aspergillus aculeatus ATCC 16872]
MPWSILPKSVTAWLNLWDERFCEDVRDFHGAQEARARLHFQGEAGKLTHVEALIRNDVALNFAIQRGAVLQSELKTLSVWLVISGAADVTTAEEIYSSIQTIEPQLSTLEETIWRLERRTHEVLSRFPEGPLERAVNCNRARSHWHMAPLLKEDCAGRDGCCTRKCRCCAKPRSTARAKQGHCTSACA